MNFAGKALLRDRQGDHQVEAKQGQVGQVVPRKGLPLEMGMNAAQAPQAAAPQAETAQVGNDDLTVVADDDIFHRPLAIDDDPQLAMEFRGTFGQIPGQLAGNYLGGRDAAMINPLQSLDLTRLESGNVAVNHLLLTAPQSRPRRGLSVRDDNGGPIQALTTVLKPAST